MAKITAHGEREHVRYRGLGGASVVLTVRPDLRPGRLLHKHATGRAYNLVRQYDRDTLLIEAELQADFYAARCKYAQAAVRGG